MRRVDLKTGMAAAVVMSIAVVVLLAWLEVGLFFQVLAAVTIASGLTALLDGAQ
jgi:hypothetical protein